LTLVYKRKPYLNLQGIRDQIRMIADPGKNPGVARPRVEVADQESLRRIDRSGFIEALYRD